MTFTTPVPLHRQHQTQSHPLSQGSSYNPASPIRSSPLSNPPVYSPSHIHPPSPSPSTSTRANAQPRPIPSSSTSTRRRSLLHNSHTTPTGSSPSRSPHTHADVHTHFPSPSPSPTGRDASSSASTSTTPSPPLSRSHPLLGSYSLSLLHSRMSHAHAPHSLFPSANNGFSIHLGALGKGKSCPAELRCPAHEVIPFSATYYDLEDRGRTTQTPWVGNVDLQDHYFRKYSHHSSEDGNEDDDEVQDEDEDVDMDMAGPSHTSKMPASSPPSYPGYRVAPVGQLQILVRTADQAVKVFLVPYNLRNLPVGGRLLARERTFVQSQASRPGTGTSTPTKSNSSTPTMSPLSPSSPSPSLSSRTTGGPKEKLRYSFQLQFICVPRPPPDISSARDASTTRRATRSNVAATASEVPVRGDSQPRPGKDYYVSRAIRMIFTSSPPEKDEITRTERHDEVILPSETQTQVHHSHVGSRGRYSFSPVSPQSFSRVHPRSLGKEDWDVVRRKWLARKEMEAAAASLKPVTRLPLPLPLPVEQVRPSTPPISLLSSQVISPPTHNPATPTRSIHPTLSPLPILSPLPLLPGSPHRSRPATPTRTASPQPPSVKTPTPHRYPSRQKLRRGSGSVDERELSERLRELGMGSGEG